MKRLFHPVLSFMMIGVMNLFVLGAYSSAASPSSTHPMPQMNHAKLSVNCIALCASAASNKQSDLKVVDDESDDEPSEPFYLASQQSLYGLKARHTATAREVVKFEPPPGLPGYIRFGVFRV